MQKKFSLVFCDFIPTIYLTKHLQWQTMTNDYCIMYHVCVALYNQKQMCIVNSYIDNNLLKRPDFVQSI